jgi:protein subunit release factor A
VPPTEKRGRVHTSTVTVAVLELETRSGLRLDPREVEERVTRDSGPGGQHRNTTDSCVVVRHLPTGLEAKAAAKSQHRNREAAWALLTARVAEHHRAHAAEDRNSRRREHLGSGMRGDKVRTYRVRDDRVTDHRSGRQARLKTILAGRLDELA